MPTTHAEWSLLIVTLILRTSPALGLARGGHLQKAKRMSPAKAARIDSNRSSRHNSQHKTSTSRLFNMHVGLAKLVSELLISPKSKQPEVPHYLSRAVAAWYLLVFSCHFLIRRGRSISQYTSKVSTASDLLLGSHCTET